MVLLYDKLYRSVEVDSIPIDEYLSRLADEVVDMYHGNDRIVVEKEIEPVTLSPESVFHLGIMINELLTNAMKYAFPGKARGVIRISAERNNGLVRICISDNGVGLPESVSPETSTGFGFQLIESLVAQLRGTMQIERDKGATFIIDFPA